MISTIKSWFTKAPEAPWSLAIADVLDEGFDARTGLHGYRVTWRKAGVELEQRFRFPTPKPLSKVKTFAEQWLVGVPRQ